MIEVFVPLAVVTSGLAAGGLTIASLGGAPLLLSLPTDRYLPVHQFLVKRFDPFMPINLVGTALLDAVIAGLADETGTRVLALIAVALYAAVMYVSLTKNVPINKWVGTIDPERLPADWDRIDPRVRWRNWNLVRTVLAVTGLLLNAAIVATLL